MQVNFYYILLTFYIILCLFLVLLVLIQKGRGGGLASAFGGVGGNTAFGAKTGDVLTWATSIVFGVLMLMTITLTMLGNSIDDANKARNDPRNLIAPPVATGSNETSNAPTALPVDSTVVPTTIPSTLPTTQP